MSIGPHAPAQMLCGSGVTVPAGGMLYALSHRSFDKEDPHSLQVMSWTTPPARPWLGPSMMQQVLAHKITDSGE